MLTETPIEKHQSRLFVGSCHGLFSRLGSKSTHACTLVTKGNATGLSVTAGRWDTPDHGMDNGDTTGWRMGHHGMGDGTPRYGRWDTTG